MALKYDLSVAVLLCALLSFGLVYFLFSKKAKSEVIISDRMSEFIDAIDQSTVKKDKQLIIFDLDDTVFQSSSILGSPTWYYNMVNILRQNGAASFEAFHVVGEIDEVIQENIKVVSVEETTITAIKTWQNLGATVVAVTSRPSSFQNIIADHLLQIGVQFNAPIFKCVENSWDSSLGVFKNGVIYAGKNFSKDEAFIKFYEVAAECGLTVELLGQADDQQRYVSKISKFAEDHHVNYIGIIYGGALSRTEFNIAEANQQLRELEIALKRSIIPESYRSIFINAH